MELSLPDEEASSIQALCVLFSCQHTKDTVPFGREEASFEILKMYIPAKLSIT
jgi:hypothetical protein